MNTPADRGHLETEQRDPRANALHQSSVADSLNLLNQHHYEAARAFEQAQPEIEAFISAIEPGFKAGGRLIYLGAGTSGRLGVLDASEAPPTFCVPHDKVIGIIAGGDTSLRRSSEGKEDDPHGAIPALEALQLVADDAVIGIAAGGTTPYVHGALQYCKSLSASPETCMISCATIPQSAYMDHLILLPTGPEIITGSTRMKAGTVTKLTLNAISTTLMIRSGRVYENLMVDVRATNAKLLDRALRILCQLTSLDRNQANALLLQAQGHTKSALVMHAQSCDFEQAQNLLSQSDQRLEPWMNPIQ